MRRLAIVIVLAACLIALAVAPARAEPITISIFSAIGITLTAGSTAAAVATFAVTTALSMGVSYLAAKLTAPPSQAQQQQQAAGGTRGTLQAGVVPRSFIVGRSMTEGSLAYANTFQPAASKTPNSHLVQVITLSDIPVTGMPGLWVNGEQVTFNQLAAPDEFGAIAIPEYTVSGVEHLWVRFYDGTQVAADPFLVATFGTDPDRPYTSARVGVGIAYAIVIARINEELFRRFPACKFELDGIRLYDRREDSTAGGSGPQRANNPATWEFSANNVVIVENILRGIRYGGSWFYGAQTVAAAQLPSASFVAAANECDVAIDLAGGGTEPQYAAGGEIRLDQAPADVIEELLKACNGRLAEIGGAYKVRAGAAGAAVFSFTDADILSTEQQTFDPFPGLGDTVNHVTAKYVSPAEGYVWKDAPPLVDLDLETEDGRRLSADVAYGFVKSGTAVQRLMRAERDGQRAFRRHALPMPPDAFVLEPLDVVSWTSERNGYVNKQFDVISAEDLPSLNVGLALQELDPNAYDWDPEADEQPIVDGTITIVRPPPQPIVDFFALPHTLSSGGLTRPAVRIGWDPDADDVDGILYEVRLKSPPAPAADVVARGEGDAHIFRAGSLVVSHNLLANTQYQARAQYRPHSDRPAAWSDWLDVTTPNTHVVPMALAAGAFDPNTFEARLARYAVEIERASRDFDRIQQFIASFAAEQEASNWLDRATAQTVINEREERVRSVLDGISASVSFVQQALADQQFAFAAFKLAAEARLADSAASAAISASSLATLDVALASLTLSVNASIASLNASVTTVSTAIADVNGRLVGSWALKVGAGDALGEIVLLADGATGKSFLRFLASTFQIALPGVTGGDPVVPFQLGTRDGGPALVLRADLVMPDGSILARHGTFEMINVGTLIANDILGYTKLQDDAASKVESAQNASTNITLDGTTITDLVTCPVTSVGGHFVLIAQVTLNHDWGLFNAGTAYDGSTYDLDVWLDVDGSNVRALVVPAYTYAVNATGAGGAFVSSRLRTKGHFTLVHKVQLAAGSRTIKVRAKSQQNKGGTLTFTLPTIVSTEARGFFP